MDLETCDYLSPLLYAFHGTTHELHTRESPLQVCQVAAQLGGSQPHAEVILALKRQATPPTQPSSKRPHTLQVSVRVVPVTLNPIPLAMSTTTPLWLYPQQRSVGNTSSPGYPGPTQAAILGTSIYFYQPPWWTTVLPSSNSLGREVPLNVMFEYYVGHLSHPNRMLDQCVASRSR